MLMGRVSGYSCTPPLKLLRLLAGLLLKKAAVVVAAIMALDFRRSIVSGKILSRSIS